jgi:hypothetical protein
MLDCLANSCGYRFATFPKFDGRQEKEMTRFSIVSECSHFSIRPKMFWRQKLKIDSENGLEPIPPSISVAGALPIELYPHKV